MPVSTTPKNEQTLSLAGKKYPFRSLPPCDLGKCTRRQIREYFENSYDLDELVFTAIKDEQYFCKCPDRLRLPLIFYLCHTATLYVNKLLLAGMIEKRVNRHFEIMFETGVDEMSWDDTENYRMGGSFKWPRLSEVLEYRRQVRELVIDTIENAPLELPVTQDHPWGVAPGSSRRSEGGKTSEAYSEEWSLFMGMEHERIHFETSSVLIRQLPAHVLQRPENWKYAPARMDEPAGPNEFVRVAGSKMTLGKPADFPSYGWDNEYGKQEMKVPEFEATKYLVTNQEFHEFVRDGGYQRRELWTEEGWQWAQFRQARHPLFWVCGDGCKSNCGSELASYSHCNLKPLSQESSATNGDSSQDGSATNGDSVESKFKYRAIYDVIDMPWEWPVDVNYHEAKAFCTWKGPEYRLPTEAEHHLIRGDPPVTKDVNCDPCYNLDIPANINLKYGSSSPVNMYPPNSMGFHDTYGNVWEWSEDHFNGFNGFKTNFLYDDFSSPCFDGRHTMMMGGSWASTGDEASRFSRFAFRRHFFQHLGFRMVRSLPNPPSTPPPTPVKFCMTDVFVLGAGVTDNPITVGGVDPALSYQATANPQYLYDAESALDAILEEQHARAESYTLPLFHLIESAVQKFNKAKTSAITLGCGAGLTSILLTRVFQKVVGVDYGARFIDAGMRLQRGEALEYGTPQKVARATDFEGVDPERVVFKQLTWISNEIEDFDLVLFEFLDRLAEPKGWLCKLWECLSPRGLAVFAASKKWDGEKIGQYIGKWFNLLDETTVGMKTVTVWQLKI